MTKTRIYHSVLAICFVKIMCEFEVVQPYILASKDTYVLYIDRWHGADYTKIYQYEKDVLSVCVFLYTHMSSGMKLLHPTTTIYFQCYVVIVVISQWCVSGADLRFISLCYPIECAREYS